MRIRRQLKSRFSLKRCCWVTLRYIFVAVLFCLTSCGNDKPQYLLLTEKELPDHVDFNFDVKPILSDKCFACHGPDSKNQKAGLRLDTKEGAFELLGEYKDHYAIVPGNINKSHVYKRIISNDPEVMMPPPESHLKLNHKEIAIITNWIEQGAEYKPHWAFIAPEKEDKANASIDVFVEEKLVSHNLQFASLATKETLIRRASFDLTGMPPTIEEIDAFMNDTSPNAYEKNIDRLLESEAYGERMASNWLDVARYADSDGYLDDKHRDFSPYRDWVIKAFNENMPYNQFVTWQLAGDLIPDANQESKLATAFNRLNKKNSEAGIVFEEYRVEYAADRTNAVGKAFLGLSLECARCHDHKYDPIPQKDYYKMFGFFNSTFELGTAVYGPDQTPGPALLLSSKAQEEQRKELLKYIEQIEIEKESNSLKLNDFDRWKLAPKLTLSSLAKNLNKALVAHYSFDKIKQIDQNNFSLIEERSGKNVAKMKNPLFKKGVKGNAFFVSDYNSGVIADKIGWYERTEPFSIQLWVNPNTTYEDVGVLWHSESFRLGLKGYMIKLKDNKPSFLMSHSWPQNAIEVTSNQKLPEKEWSQITITYDGSSTAEGVKIYINGQVQELQVDLDNLYKGILYEKNIHTYGFKGILFGARGHFVPFKDGGIDELKIFDRALTQIEVKLTYNKDGFSIDKEEPLLKEYYNQIVNQENKELDKKLEKIRTEENTLVNSIPEIMVMGDLPEPRPTHVLNRGVYNAKGDQVEPGGLDEIFKFDEDLPKNRLGLAQWICDDQNPLTARVIVNRIWQMHFGMGLVKTSEDFGNQGALPSHPELLDWLAVDFKENGWDIKRLQKKILLSRTYMQKSEITKESVEMDPENKLLARGARFRLPAEMVRDNALAISGLLVDKIGGESVYPYQPEGIWDGLTTKGWAYRYLQEPGEGLYRKSLYSIWKRTSPPPSMLIFDIADRGVCTVKRTTTNTPLQALVLLNDPQFIEASRVLAERLIVEQEDKGEQLEKMFRIVTGRQPDIKEVTLLNEFYNEEYSNFKQNKKAALDFLSTGEHSWNRKLNPIEIASLGVVANAVMNTDEAITRK